MLFDPWRSIAATAIAALSAIVVTIGRNAALEQTAETSLADLCLIT
jgi:hypothetical protein